MKRSRLRDSMTFADLEARCAPLPRLVPMAPCR
jgi:hypothetical protein